MKLVAISDIHGFLLEDYLPAGDLLTISGDVCPVDESHHPTHQRHWVDRKFLPYLDKMIKSGQYKDIVFVGGNHDYIFENLVGDMENAFRKTLPDHVHYLKDSSIVIDGKLIYGTPWITNLPRWAFNATEDVLHNKFMDIPDNVDLLISHAPVYGYCDTIMKPIYDGQAELGHLGGKSLCDHVKRAQCKLVVVGHIHSGNHDIEKLRYDWDNIDSKHSEIVNVSILDEDYAVAYPAFQKDI